MNRKPGRDAPASADPPDWDLIHTQREFEDLLEEWSGVERYALDTEFHRERTYHPRVALVRSPGPAAWR
ncbi:MAG: hypothetical protein R2704_16775 [Microthrixaceae bacterium]